MGAKPTILAPRCGSALRPKARLGLHPGLSRPSLGPPAGHSFPHVQTIAAHRAEQWQSQCLDATLRPSPTLTRAPRLYGVAIRMRYGGR
jgi:hypothetical protein